MLPLSQLGSSHLRSHRLGLLAFWLDIGYSTASSSVVMATGPLEPLAYVTAKGEEIPEAIWTNHAIPKHKPWTVLFQLFSLSSHAS